MHALVVFVFKLTSGNSSSTIFAIFGSQPTQWVSDFTTSVLRSFETDFLPSRFGIKAVSRNDLLQNHTLLLAKK